MDIKIAREVAARIWCDQEMSSIPMNADVAEKIAQILVRYITQDGHIISSVEINTDNILPESPK